MIHGEPLRPTVMGENVAVWVGVYRENAQEDLRRRRHYDDMPYASPRVVHTAVRITAGPGTEG